MTVADLIEELSKIDPDRVLIMQKDAEGNGYSPLHCIDGENVGYHADCTWAGDVSYETLTKELKDDGYSEEDVRAGGTPCVVLCPVN